MSETHNYCDAPNGSCLLGKELDRLQDENAELRAIASELARDNDRAHTAYKMANAENIRLKSALEVIASRDMDQVHGTKLTSIDAWVDLPAVQLAYLLADDVTEARRALGISV